MMSEKQQAPNYFLYFLSFWIIFYTIIILSWYGLYSLSHLHHHLHGSFFNVFGMWALMIVAMMVPTILPYLHFYNNLKYTKSDDVTNVHLMFFVLGYIVCWLLYAIMGSVLQYILYDFQLINHQATIIEKSVAITVIMCAAIYHILPFRLKALSKCQNPMPFFMQYWSPSYKTSLFLGYRHSIDCILCCWVFMLLMFLGAMSDLRIMIILTAIMVIEKFPISKKNVSYFVSFMLFALFVMVLISESMFVFYTLIW